MKVYVLITNDNVISGIYTSQEKLLSDLTTTFSNLTIENVEVWEPDKGFIDYLKVNKTTTITIEN